MKRFLPLCALLCATLPAFAFLDSNNNGLSDLWERTYNNGQLFDPSFDPQADADGDGWTNAQEAAAGTNPFDPNPPEGIVRPQLTNIPAVWSEPDENGDSVIVTPASMFMEWQTTPGKQYTLLYSPDLIDWLAVPNETFIGSGSIRGYGIELTDEKLFWRVKIDDVDSDGDGLTNAEEAVLGTDPTLADSDEDGMPDAWEVKWALNPLDPADAAADADGDHVSNLREYELGTVPTGIYRIEVLPIGGFPYFHSAADDGSVVVQASLDPSSALALVTAPDANGDRELVDPAPAGNWHDLETIMADLVEGGTLEENDTLDPSGLNSSDGTFRVYQSSTDLLILQEPGVFVGTLAFDVSWQAINNHGVAAATAERLVAAANGIPEHYEGDVLISDGVTTTAAPMPADWFPASALPWVQAFSDDDKVLVYRPMATPARPETYLLDVATGAYTFVKQPGLGGESIVCLSSRNGRMLGSGPTPFQITQDGTPIRLEGLQIKSSPTSEVVSLASLYPNTFVPHHICSDGRITLTTTDSGNQIAILQLVPYNDTANTGMSNDWIASEIAYLASSDPTRWGYLATAGTLDPDTCYWDDRWTAIQSYRLSLSSFSRQLSRFADADGDGVVDADDADPFDLVVDWKPAPEASYAVIVLAQVNYNGLSGMEPAVTGSSITASIGRTRTVLWNDKFKEGSGPWQDRCRVWKDGVWSGDIRKTPSTFADCMLETEEGMVAATPYHPETSDIADAFPHAVCGDSVVGRGNYTGNGGVSAWPVATLWNLVTQSGTSTWNATPVAPPPMDVGMYENPYAMDDYWIIGGYRAIASPGGALAVLGGDLPLADQRKWKIWNPPAVPGTDPYAPGVGDPTWEKSYKTADGKIFKFTAVEDGGSVVGQRYSGPYQYDRCLIAIDSGVEEELPGSAGWLADVNAVCRVNRDDYARSRLVAAGTDLWVKRGSQWSIATHSPTVSPVLAVADNGILMGSHSIWRNGQEILLDDLVANLKVNDAPRYTNLRAYAMNGDGAIVALANDASNPGEGNKALILLLPVEIEQQGYAPTGGIKFCRWLDAFQGANFDNEFADKDRDHFRIRIPAIIPNLTKIKIKSTGLNGAVIDGAVAQKTTDGNYEVEMKQENGAMVSTWILLVSDGDDDKYYNGKGTDDGDNDQTLLADFESKIIVSFPEFDSVEVEFSAQKAVGNVTLDTVYLSPAGDVPLDFLTYITLQVAKMQEIYRQIGIRVDWFSNEGDTISQTMLDAEPNEDPTKPVLEVANHLNPSECQTVRNQILEWTVHDKHVRIGYVNATMTVLGYNYIPVNALGFTDVGTDGILVSLSDPARETLGVTAHEVGHTLGLDDVAPGHLLMKSQMIWMNSKYDPKRFEEGNFNTMKKKEAFYVPLQ